MNTPSFSCANVDRRMFTTYSSSQGSGSASSRSSIDAIDALSDKFESFRKSREDNDSKLLSFLKSREENDSKILSYLTSMASQLQNVASTAAAAAAEAATAATAASTDSIDALKWGVSPKFDRAAFAEYMSDPALSQKVEVEMSKKWPKSIHDFRQVFFQQCSYKLSSKNCID